MRSLLVWMTSLDSHHQAYLVVVGWSSVHVRVNCHNLTLYVLVIVRISSCTRYNDTRGGVEIVIQYEAHMC